MRILAIIAEACTTATCLDGATALAAALGGASVEALHVKVDPRQLNRSPEEVAIQQLRERDEGTAEQRAEATRKAFNDWCNGQSSHHPPIRFKELVGAEEESVFREAMQFDLLVLAHPHNLDAHDALHAAIFSSGRPAVLLPQEWRASTQGLGKRIAIAWNDTPPACKALDGAMPLLRRAQSAILLMIAASAEKAESVVARCADEGIALEVRQIARSSGSLGARLIAAADHSGADLLVMGAYRHNEFVEWLLGGTTRNALSKADLPLLLAH